MAWVGSKGTRHGPTLSGLGVPANSLHNQIYADSAVMLAARVCSLGSNTVATEHRRGVMPINGCHWTRMS